MNHVEFLSNVSSIKTLKDGGYRITLDIFENQSEQVKTLIDLINKNVQVAVIELPKEVKDDFAIAVSKITA